MNRISAAWRAYKWNRWKRRTAKKVGKTTKRAADAVSFRGSSKSKKKKSIWPLQSKRKKSKSSWSLRSSR